MPIYEYRCSSCGHQQEFLQKLSDATLTVCTACGKAAFSKMLTAAGFQLKGSGWYATDFRNAGAAPAKAADSNSEARPADSSGGKAEGQSESKAEGKSQSKAEGKAEGMSESKAEGKAEGKSESKAEGKSGSKADGVGSGAGSSGPAKP